MKKIIFKFVGITCVGLGTLGAFLPLLPTTPFLLLALFCFARSSDKLGERLKNNRFLGSYISAYVQGDGMSRRTKIRTLVLLWVVCGTSALFFTDLWWVRVILGVVVIGVTIHIATMKSKVKNGKQTSV